MSTFAYHLGSFVERELVVGLKDHSFCHNARDDGPVYFEGDRLVL